MSVCDASYSYVILREAAKKVLFLMDGLQRGGGGEGLSIAVEKLNKFDLLTTTYPNINIIILCISCPWENRFLEIFA